MRPDSLAWLALRTGCRGVLSWGAFAAVEAALFVLVPAAREHALVVTPAARIAPWAVIFCLYLGAGFAAGVAAGALAGLAGFRAERGGAAARDLAQLTLAAAWAAHLAGVAPLSRSTYLSLAVALLLAVVLGVRLARPGRWAWGECLVGPWGAAVALMAPIALRDALHLTWLTSRLGGYAAGVKMAVSALATLALIAALVALGRLAARRGAAARRLGARQAAALPAVVGAVLLAGWAADTRLLSRLGGPAPKVPRTRVTGVLLITMDSVRADHLSTYGYRLDTTPGLRSMLSHATLFRRAVAASDMSLGTHSSLFTGLYPSRHGAYEAPGYPAGRPLGARHATLAERLGEAGFAPIGAAANGYFLNAAYGVTRGFALFDVQANDRLEMQSRVRRLAGLLPGRAFSVHRRASELNAVLLAGIEAAREASRPFFAFANYMEGHAPYTFDAALAANFPGADPGSRIDGTAFLARGSRPVFDERERARLVARYDAAIATLDRELTRLFAALRERGLYDGMLVVITADHGELLGEHGTFGHGTGLAEEVLQVPLIVKFPWQGEGRVVEARVSQVDVLPTVLEALGLEPPAAVDGRSLLAAGVDEGRVVLAEAPPARALYLGRFKLVVSGRGERQLFDVEADRAQRVDLLDAPGAAVRDARRALESRLAAPVGPAPPGVDPAAAERLRSLGYVR